VRLSAKTKIFSATIGIDQVFAEVTVYTIVT